MNRLKLLTLLLAAAAPIWVAGQGSNFMGGTPTPVDAAKVRTTRLRFPKGSRSNWHSHTWGQLLMLEEGTGRTQVRGGPVRKPFRASRGGRRPASSTGTARRPIKTRCS